MADYATVALFDLSPAGKIVQANDTFYNILGLRKRDLESDPFSCWLDTILKKISLLSERTRRPYVLMGNIFQTRYY